MVGRLALIPSRTVDRLKRILDLVLVAALTAGIVFWAGGRRQEGEPPARPNILGKPLPELIVKTINGDPVRLSGRLGKHASLIYLMSPVECASCSNLPLEFKIVRRDLPYIQPLLIGSGAPPEAFRAALGSSPLLAEALVDEHRELLRAFRVSAEPLVDSTGRILLVDVRSTSAAAQFPMGTVLYNLATVFNARSSQR
jgi:hypothetical protein